jgi:hypothetical protein
LVHGLISVIVVVLLVEVQVVVPLLNDLQPPRFADPLEPLEACARQGLAVLCPGQEPSLSVVKRPARPFKSAIQKWVSYGKR